MKTAVSEIDLEKRQIILDAFRSGLGRVRATEKISEKFGDCIGYGIRTCERWYAKFKQGDFDLTVKPRDKCSKDRTYCKKKRITKKAKQQEQPTLQQTNENKTDQNLRPNKRQLPVSNNAAVMQQPVTQNTARKRSKVSHPPTLIPYTTRPMRADYSSTDTDSEVFKLRSRRPRSKGIEIALPVSAAKRMKTHTLTENHRIGFRNNTIAVGRNHTLNRNIQSRDVTVQFQNMVPDIVKNTVYKSPRRTLGQQSNFKGPFVSNTYPATQLKIVNVAHIPSLSPTKRKSSEHETSSDSSYKRPISTPQSAPTKNAKGFIYLNRKEVFRPNFNGFGNKDTPKRPKNNIKIVKSAPKILSRGPNSETKKISSSLPTPQPEKQDPIVLSDSDDGNEDDLILPENVSFPAPKLKTDTFVTYWDMESGQMIQLNDEKEPVLPNPAPTPAVSVIEID